MEDEIKEVEEKDEQPKTKKKTTKKEEEVPTWAKSLIQTMETLSEKLTNNEQTTEEVIKVEVPPMPQPKDELEEETIEEVEQLEEELQKPSKKKSFLDYLF